MSLTVPLPPDRNHIAKRDLKHWAKHFHVTPAEIKAAIDKVGNAVVAVESELKRHDLKTEAKADQPES
jgi:hypothetical protein